MCKKKIITSSGLFKNVIFKMCLEIIYLIYMYKKDLALNDVQWSVCHKTKTKTKPNQTNITVYMRGSS